MQDQIKRKHTAADQSFPVLDWRARGERLERERERRARLHPPCSSIRTGGAGLGWAGLVAVIDSDGRNSHRMKTKQARSTPLSASVTVLDCTDSVLTYSSPALQLHTTVPYMHPRPRQRSQAVSQWWSDRARVLAYVGCPRIGRQAERATVQAWGMSEHGGGASSAGLGDFASFFLHRGGRRAARSAGGNRNGPQ